MSIALYRRYRPETFAEVIGQSQVTVPLTAAFRSGRVNHAYLFSGPRGCGKTTSARILARTLNCVENTPEHPIDTPCGKCPSCIELSRDCNGSLDVVEIDAASHGGVDAARDLRERATFTPTRDRYKIFIIDEAHMVTKEGFNALLKVVEEPPPHIKFVFATTEPDKVLGTIRSRTHHYPFRLVSPSVLGPYLQDVCAQEGVTLGDGILQLVLRAGGGSVRDSLSVLDQLIAGSAGGEVEYQTAIGLLGYTSSAILDDAVSAIAAHDGAGIFGVVSKVIDAGITPQRFVEDLLERFRDLIVVAVAGDQASVAMGERPEVEVQALQSQAGLFPAAELTRLGELISTGLNQMVGATSPRLQLELLLARLVVSVPDALAAGGDVAASARREDAQPTATTAPVGRRRPAVAATAPGAASAPQVAPGAAASARPVGPSAVTPPPITAAQAAVPDRAVPPPAAPGATAPPPVTAAEAVVPNRAAPPPAAPVAASASPARVAPAIPSESAPTTASQAAVPAGGANSELAWLQAQWAGLAAGVSSPVTRGMLTLTVGPVAMAADEVLIGVTQPAMVGRLSEPRQLGAVSNMLSEALGRPVKVKFEAASQGAPSAAAPAQRPARPSGGANQPPRAQGQPGGQSGEQYGRRAASAPSAVAEASAKSTVQPHWPSVGGSSEADSDADTSPGFVSSSDAVTSTSAFSSPDTATAPDGANSPDAVNSSDAAISDAATNPQDGDLAATRSAADTSDEDWLAGIPNPLTRGSSHVGPSSAVNPDGIALPGVAPTPPATPQPSNNRSAHPRRAAAGHTPPAGGASSVEEDEAAPDDPIADTGLRGVAAALKILDGTIIEETYIE